MKIVLPYVQAQLQHASMVDVVWDQYRSLKPERRLHQSPRKLASVSATVLADWNDRVVYPHGNSEASIYYKLWGCSVQSPQRLLLPRPVQPCRDRQPNDSALGRCFQCGSSGCLLGQVDTLVTFRTRDCYIPRP